MYIYSFIYLSLAELGSQPATASCCISHFRMVDGQPSGVTMSRFVLRHVTLMTCYIMPSCNMTPCCFAATSRCSRWRAPVCRGAWCWSRCCPTRSTSWWPGPGSAPPPSPPTPSTSARPVGDTYPILTSMYLWISMCNNVTIGEL